MASRILRQLIHGTSFHSEPSRIANPANSQSRLRKDQPIPSKKFSSVSLQTQAKEFAAAGGGECHGNETVVRRTWRGHSRPAIRKRNVCVLLKLKVAEGCRPGEDREVVRPRDAQCGCGGIAIKPGH